MTMRPKRDDETQDAFVIACVRWDRDQEWRGWINKVLSDQEQDRLFRKFPPPTAP